MAFSGSPNEYGRLNASALEGPSPYLYYADVLDITEPSIATASHTPHMCRVEWDWDDGGTSGTGTWTYGSVGSHWNKNESFGPTAAHVYEITIGGGDQTFNPTVSMYLYDADGDEVTSKTWSLGEITVKDPFTYYTNIYHLSNDTTHTNTDATYTDVDSVSDWDDAIATYAGDDTWLIFQEGDTWTASTLAARSGGTTDLRISSSTPGTAFNLSLGAFGALDMGGEIIGYHMIDIDASGTESAKDGETLYDLNHQTGNSQANVCLRCNVDGGQSLLNIGNGLNTTYQGVGPTAIVDCTNTNRNAWNSFWAYMPIMIGTQIEAPGVLNAHTCRIACANGGYFAYNDWAGNATDVNIRWHDFLTATTVGKTNIFGNYIRLQSTSGNFFEIERGTSSQTDSTAFDYNVEANLFVAEAGSTYVQMARIEGGRVMMRNNVFLDTAGHGARCIYMYEQGQDFTNDSQGVQTAWVIGNTAHTADTTGTFTLLEVAQSPHDIDSVTSRSNFVSAFAGATPEAVSDAASTNADHADNAVTAVIATAAYTTSPPTAFLHARRTGDPGGGGVDYQGRTTDADGKIVTGTADAGAFQTTGSAPSGAAVATPEEYIAVFG